LVILNVENTKVENIINNKRIY